MSPTVDEFVARRRAAWDELEARVRGARRGTLRDVPTGELERLGVLYRRAAGDLAIARRDHPGESVTDYLNDLVARAHPILYRSPPPEPAALLDLFATGIPRSFRQARPFVLISVALLLGGVALGWLAVALRPDLASSLVPQGSLFDEMARGQVPSGTDTGFATGLGITLNNVRTALTGFVGGALLGVPTAIMLAYNGWILGTLAGAIHRDGLDTTFWPYIAPHGVLELSIIVLSGAAGLMLTNAVLRPGTLRRSDALAAVAPAALGLAGGTACLLVVCGMVEGYLSPSGAPPWVKLAVGAVTGAVLYSWLLLAGRPRSARPVVFLDRMIEAAPQG